MKPQAVGAQRKRRGGRTQPLQRRRWLGAGLMLLALLGGVGGWYVFVAGAPQLDAPQEVADTTLDFQIVSYQSALFGADRTYGLILPPGYEKNSHQRYPVVFLLHGGHGQPSDWTKKASALPTIQKLYAEGKLPLAIIIAPDGNDKRGSSPFWDPQYYDGDNGPVMSSIGDELVGVVKSRYRTWEEPSFWALGGLSSGGWGALNIGLRHLHHFSVLFSHSGYFKDPSGPQNSPLDIVEQVPPELRPKFHVYLDAGAGDGRFLDESKQLHQALDRLQIANRFNEFPGGHGIVGADVGWNYWRIHLADSLTYVGEKFRESAHRERKKLTGDTESNLWDKLLHKPHKPHP
jgi:enterochelin esterase-like enzyme